MSVRRARRGAALPSRAEHLCHRFGGEREGGNRCSRSRGAALSASHRLFISLSEKADRLIPALTDPDPQERAWGDHGFRGPLGRIGRGGPKVSGIAVAIESITDAGRQRDARLAGATLAFPDEPLGRSAEPRFVRRPLTQWPALAKPPAFARPPTLARIGTRVDSQFSRKERAQL